MGFKSLELTFSNEFDLEDEIILSWDLLPTMSSFCQMITKIRLIHDQQKMTFERVFLPEQRISQDYILGI